MPFVKMMADNREATEITEMERLQVTFGNYPIPTLLLPILVPWEIDATIF